MENFKKPSGKKMPPAKSLNELMKLLMKLNAKVREKFSPGNEKEAAPENVDLVIIIMTNQEMKAPFAKAAKPAKAKPLKDDWIHSLCEEIERGAHTQK